MITDWEKKTAYELLEYTAYIRGKYINIVTHIEKQIDIKIANHFCNTEDRALEIVDLLLGDKYITFESKRAIFMMILKKHQPKFYSEHKLLLGKLESILMQRNRFAHLMVAVSEESLTKFANDKTIALVKFGLNTETIYYTPDEVQELLDTAASVRTLFLW